MSCLPPVRNAQDCMCTLELTTSQPEMAQWCSLKRMIPIKGFVNAELKWLYSLCVHASLHAVAACRVGRMLLSFQGMYAVIGLEMPKSQCMSR